MPRVNELFSYPAISPKEGLPASLLKLKPESKVAFQNLIGIEVEVENVDGYKATGWQLTEDHSLRNGGAEYITAPIYAHQAPYYLTGLLSNALLERGCSFSPRTSIHVHVDVRHLAPSKIWDIVNLYSLFESLLYRYVGKNRKRNIYCVPLNENHNIRGLFTSRRDSNFEWHKYSGLNVAPVQTQGTIEFRHMHGTFDVDKVCNWLNLILSLVNYAEDKELKGPILAIENETTYLSLAKLVFGDYFSLLKYKEYKDIYHDILAANSFHINRVAESSLRSSFNLQGE